MEGAAGHLAFDGFSMEAFAILERLRQAPHIVQYRKEKAGFETHIKTPFHAFRDDLVVHGVLRHGWPLETERNVFSRLLKNDFGAGGCHHHYWMAFYRPHRTRLTDIQIVHSIHPDRFVSGLFIGSQARGAFSEAVERLSARPADALRHVNDLLRREGWQFTVERSGKSGRDETAASPMASWPAELHRARGIWLWRAWPRDRVLEAGPRLALDAVSVMEDLWPLYALVIDGEAAP